MLDAPFQPRKQSLLRDRSSYGQLQDTFPFTGYTVKETSFGVYTPEGIRARVFTTQVEGSVLLLRLWNDGPGDHFYTTNATEANNAVADGYILEDKTPMYIYPTQLCGSMPFYRLFSSRTGDHFYTIDAGERDGAEGSGWDFEWVEGYVFPPAAGSADPSKSLVSSTSASTSKLSLGSSTTVSKY
ncbi:hypothetical protein B0H14DRAFT_3458321 [Mycena olivaceomarginata]|nr:hypothetical protein B0H14DRAFT_3458321 [Mycena olivaceomarginata]